MGQVCQKLEFRCRYLRYLGTWVHRKKQPTMAYLVVYRSTVEPTQPYSAGATAGGSTPEYLAQLTQARSCISHRTHTRTWAFSLGIYLSHITSLSDLVYFVQTTALSGSQMFASHPVSTLHLLIKGRYLMYIRRLQWLP